jgi:hypothetical protein
MAQDKKEEAREDLMDRQTKLPAPRAKEVARNST